LQTFSIGFKDEPYFDETRYARMVAKKLNTQHTVFSLTNDDLYAHVHSILDYIDEPFADSSAIAVSILSEETRKHATVAFPAMGRTNYWLGITSMQLLTELYIRDGLKVLSLHSILFGRRSRVQK